MEEENRKGGDLMDKPKNYDVKHQGAQVVRAPKEQSSPKGTTTVQRGTDLRAGKNKK